MAGPAPLRVMLVDDHAVVREGYRRLLELDPACRWSPNMAMPMPRIDALERAWRPT